MICAIQLVILLMQLRLKKRGCESVNAYITHGVSNPAIEKQIILQLIK